MTRVKKSAAGGRALARTALFGALAASFDALHPLCDQWLQRPRDAARKGLHGNHFVYVETGKPSSGEAEEQTAPTARASVVGRRAATAHVATYGAGQLAASWGILRALGFSVPLRAFAAGVVINLGTHWIIDRRAPLLWLAKKVNHKDGYIREVTVMRKIGKDADASGPGTALFELDAALHRAFGIFAAAVTAVLATPQREER